MGHLRKGEFGEAYQHFKFLLPLTDNSKMKAISYNAMGCHSSAESEYRKSFRVFSKSVSYGPILYGASDQSGRVLKPKVAIRYSLFLIRFGMLGEVQDEGIEDTRHEICSFGF